MSKLTIGEAAALLHTAPSTLRSWEQRLGYPTPMRLPSGRRLYDEAEIALLSDALRGGLSISSAIRQIREETGSHEALLRHALERLDLDACDALLEAAIALRGISRAFDEAVLPAVEAVVAADVDDGAAALAIAWAKDRACWGQRRAAGTMRHTVIVVDGSAEASTTRAASCILQLQLTLRAARAHALPGAVCGAYHSIARRLGASTIVFVGALPLSAMGGNAIVPARLAGFRTDVDQLGPRVEALPSQPRAAAERLLATWSQGV